MSLTVLVAAVILGFGASAQGKPNFNIKSLRTDQQPQQQPIDQTININNWGLKNDDRRMLLEMKYKIDYLYNKSTSRGNSRFICVFILEGLLTLYNGLGPGFRELKSWYERIGRFIIQI